MSLLRTDEDEVLKKELEISTVLRFMLTACFHNCLLVKSPSSVPILTFKSCDCGTLSKLLTLVFSVTTRQQLIQTRCLPSPVFCLCHWSWLNDFLHPHKLVQLITPRNTYRLFLNLWNYLTLAVICAMVSHTITKLYVNKLLEFILRSTLSCVFGSAFCAFHFQYYSSSVILKK